MIRYCSTLTGDGMKSLYGSIPSSRSEVTSITSNITSSSSFRRKHGIILYAPRQEGLRSTTTTPSRKKRGRASSSSRTRRNDRPEQQEQQQQEQRGRASAAVHILVPAALTAGGENRTSKRSFFRWTICSIYHKSNNAKQLEHQLRDNLII